MPKPSADVGPPASSRLVSKHVILVRRWFGTGAWGRDRFRWGWACAMARARTRIAAELVEIKSRGVRVV